MRYGFIQDHATTYPVRLMCDVLQVSPSGYYDWRERKESSRSQENRRLLKAIKDIHTRSRETYGYPRVHRELVAQGDACGRHRVARLMRQGGIKTRMSRLWQRARMNRRPECTEDNKLQRQFTAAQPNKKWVSDVTHIPTAQGWLYVAVVMDLYSRRLIGWSMLAKNDQTLVLSAITMALARRGAS